MLRKRLRLLVQLFKTIDTARTLRLALLLLLFITLPFITGMLQKQRGFTQNAHAQVGVLPTTGVLWIYGIKATPVDDLGPGWTSAVWYGGPNDINRFNTVPVYTGVHSISWQDTAPNDEMDLYINTPFNDTQYQYVTFFSQASQPGQRYQIYLLNGYQKRVSSPVPMADYGGVPLVGTWQVYDIPITAFKATTTMVAGIGINDPGQGPQPRIFFDDIAFSVNKGEDIGPGAGQAINLPTLPQATPMPPYYPDISPWVYIVPGIIVFLAIFFE